jgi:hypothetical protein
VEVQTGSLHNAARHRVPLCGYRTDAQGTSGQMVSGTDVVR